MCSVVAENLIFLHTNITNVIMGRVLLKDIKNFNPPHAILSRSSVIKSMTYPCATYVSFCFLSSRDLDAKSDPQAVKGGPSSRGGAMVETRVSLAKKGATRSSLWPHRSTLWSVGRIGGSGGKATEDSGQS